MRVLVAGRYGQLAASLVERAAAQRGSTWIFASRPDLDLTRQASIRRAVVEARPDLIINAAAYTAVDDAEIEPDLAEQVNARAPGLLAAAAAEAGARMIHISTDYVFDGSADQPYTEDMPVTPLGVYGRTKLAGEEAVRAKLREHAIVRTAWVYSPFGKNFVRTILSLAETRDELTVVDDQHGNPTSALDLADAVLAIVRQWSSDPSVGVGETYHYAGAGDTVWADLARAIIAGSAVRGGPFAHVKGIPSSSWPTRARRPGNSRLSSERFQRVFGHPPRCWQEALEEVLDRLIPSGSPASRGSA